MATRVYTTTSGTGRATVAARGWQAAAGGRGPQAAGVGTWQGRGLGWALMQEVIGYGEDAGLRMIEGQVLANNLPMQKMCRELGFVLERDPADPSLVKARLDLRQR